MKDLLLRIKGSQSQYTDAGKLLGYGMYYSGFITKILNFNQFSGYPHNGGEHSFTLLVTLDDFKAFLDIVKETFSGHPGLTAFVESLLTDARKSYPHLADKLA